MKEGEVIGAETCSIRDLVLVHLFALEPYEFDDVGYWHSQIGIATAIKKRQDQTSQALNMLKAEGLVRVDKRRVPGMARKRKVYFLDGDGHERGREIYTHLKGMYVVLKDEDGEVREGAYVPLGAVAANSSSPIAFIAALNLQMSYGHIKKGQYQNYIRILDRCGRLGLPSGMVSHLSDAPVVNFFVGRRKEMRDLKREIDANNKCRAIVIYGIPGIGKTTLAAKIARDYEGIYNVFWYRIHPWDSLKNILSALATFLMDLGGIHLYSHIDGGKPVSIEATVPLIAEDLDDTYSILFFDDFQRLDPKLVPFFSALVRAMLSINNAKLVAIGRQIIPFYDPTMQRSGEVFALQLQGLDIESSKQMFRSRNIDEDEFLEVYKVTKGHPLFLELLDTGGEYGGAYKDFKRYLYEEVLMKLPHKHRETLWRVSIHRYPVTVKGLFTEGDVDYDMLRDLIEKAIIQNVGQDMYDIHDMLREFFYGTMPTATRERMHLEAARYYLDNPGDREMIEAIYHLIKSRDISTAVSLLVEHGEDLIRKGLADRIMNIIDNVNIKGVDEGYWPDLYLIKAKAQINGGEYEKAQGNLYQVLILGERMDNRHVVAEALRGLGDLWALKGDYERALSNYTEALVISEDIGDPKGQAMCRMGIGHCLRAQGDTEGALREYREAESKAAVANDEVLLGRIYTEIGTTHLNAGEFTLAEDILRKAVNTLDRTGAQHEKAPTLLMLGTLAYTKGRYSDAQDYYEKCMEISEITNNLRVHAQALYYSAQAYSRMAEWDKAKAMLEMAEEAFLRIDDTSMVKKVLMFRARMAIARKDPGELKRLMKWATRIGEDEGIDTSEILALIQGYLEDVV